MNPTVKKYAKPITLAVAVVVAIAAAALGIPVEDLCGAL